MKPLELPLTLREVHCIPKPPSLEAERLGLMPLEPLLKGSDQRPELSNENLWEPLADEPQRRQWRVSKAVDEERQAGGMSHRSRDSAHSLTTTVQASSDDEKCFTTPAKSAIIRELRSDHEDGRDAPTLANGPTFPPSGDGTMLSTASISAISGHSSPTSSLFELTRSLAAASEGLWATISPGSDQLGAASESDHQHPTIDVLRRTCSEKVHGVATRASALQARATTHFVSPSGRREAHRHGTAAIVAAMGSLASRGMSTSAASPVSVFRCATTATPMAHVTHPILQRVASMPSRSTPQLLGVCTRVPSPSPVGYPEATSQSSSPSLGWQFRSISTQFTASHSRFRRTSSPPVVYQNRQPRLSSPVAQQVFRQARSTSPPIVFQAHRPPDSHCLASPPPIQNFVPSTKDAHSNPPHATAQICNALPMQRMQPLQARPQTVGAASPVLQARPCRTLIHQAAPVKFQQTIPVPHRPPPHANLLPFQFTASPQIQSRFLRK